MAFITPPTFVYLDNINRESLILKLNQLSNDVNYLYVTLSGLIPLTLPVPVLLGGTGATTAAGARTNLGLGTMAVQNADNIAVTGGSIIGINNLRGLFTNNISFVRVGSAMNLLMDTYVDSAAATDFVFRKARGAIGSEAAVQGGDNLALFDARGWNGSAFTSSGSAQIEFTATELWSTTANGSQLKFETTKNGTIVRTVVMTINQDKTVSFVAGGGLIIGASDGSAAAVNIAAGTLLSSPAAGALEYDGRVFYATPVNAARSAIPAVQITTAQADVAGSNVNTAQPVFGSTEDTLTLTANTTYVFEAVYFITRAAGAASHTTAVLFGGTATLTSIGYLAQVTNPTGNALAAVQQIWSAAATAVVLTAANTSTTENLMIVLRGIIRTNGAGTLIPQFIYSVAPGGAPTITKNSYFKIWPMGVDTVKAVGNWS